MRVGPMTPTTPSAAADAVVDRDDAHVAQLGAAVLVADAHGELAVAERVGERLEHRDAVLEELDERPSPRGVVELRLREQRGHADVVEPVAVGLGERVEDLVDDARRRSGVSLVGARPRARSRSGRMSAARLPSNAAFSARSTSASRSGAVSSASSIERFTTCPDSVMSTNSARRGAIESRSMRLTRASDTLGESTTARQSVSRVSATDVSRMSSSTSEAACSLLRGFAAALERRAALLEQVVDEGAVAGVGGHAPRRDVRLHDEAGLLEDRELVSHRRRTAAELVAVHERLAAHRRGAGYVLLHECLQHAAAAFVEHVEAPCGARSIRTPRGRDSGRC